MPGRTHLVAVSALAVGWRHRRAHRGAADDRADPASRAEQRSCGGDVPGAVRRVPWRRPGWRPGGQPARRYLELRRRRRQPGARDSRRPRRCRHAGLRRQSARPADPRAGGDDPRRRVAGQGASGHPCHAGGGRDDRQRTRALPAQDAHRRAGDAVGPGRAARWPRAGHRAAGTVADSRTRRPP